MAYRCQSSFDSYQYIETCPMDKERWEERAAKKNCSRYPKCRRPLQYHCLLNAYRNRSIEVCAPKTRLVQQFCPAYSLGGQRITDQFNCSNLFPDCPQQQYYSTEILNYKSCMQPLSQTSSNESSAYTSVRSTDLQNQLNTTSTMPFEENITFTTNIHEQATGSYPFYAVLLVLPVSVLVLAAILGLYKWRQGKETRKEDQRRNSEDLEEADNLIKPEIHPEAGKKEGETDFETEEPNSSMSTFCIANDEQQNTEQKSISQENTYMDKKEESNPEETTGNEAGEYHGQGLTDHVVSPKDVDLADINREVEMKNDSDTFIKDSNLPEELHPSIDRISVVEDVEQRCHLPPDHVAFPKGVDLPEENREIERHSDSNTCIKSSNLPEELHSSIDRISVVEDDEQRCAFPTGTNPLNTHRMDDYPFEMDIQRNSSFEDSEDDDMTSNDLYHNRANRKNGSNFHTPIIGIDTGKKIKPDSGEVFTWSPSSMLGEETTSMHEPHAVIDNNISTQPTLNNDSAISIHANNYRMNASHYENSVQNEFPVDINIKTFANRYEDFAKKPKSDMEVKEEIMKTSEENMKIFKEETHNKVDKEGDRISENEFTITLRNLMTKTLKEYFEPGLEKDDLPKDKSTVTSSIRKQSKEIFTLKKRLDEVEKKQDNIKVLEERITALEEERKAYKMKIEDLQRELVDLKMQTEEEHQEKDKFIQKVLQEKIKLREELDRKEKEIHDLAEEVNNLKKELRDLLAER